MRRRHPIEELIAQGEHQQLDFKFEVSDSKKIARTLSAFANTDGGRLLIGVKDNGAIAGVRSDEECLAQVIKETNAGLAATNVEQVKEFISDKYAEWKTNGFTRQPVNQEAKKRFTRQFQSEQIEHLIYD